MTQPSRIARWAGVAATLLALSCTDPPASRPNVLVLLGDTVRADRMGVYGYEHDTTPHIDAFAKGARVFERASSPAPWTLPSHASLFTGLDVSAHHTDRPGRRLAPGETTMAEAFRAAGYDTYAFTANPWIADRTGLTQGFDLVEHAWDERWSGEIRERIAARLVPGDVNAGRLKTLVDGEAQWAYQVAGDTARRAFLAWLDGRGDHRPFFAFINYMEAHATRLPSADARARLVEPDLDRHSLQVPQTVGAAVAWMAGAHRYDERDLEALGAVYDASLSDWDESIGTLLDDLERHGLLDDTIVVITADHGESLGEHGRIGHQFNVHQSVTHVPFLVRYPARVRAGRVAEAVSTAELFSIVSEIADLELAPRDAARLEKASRRRAGIALTEYPATHPSELAQLRRHAPENIRSFERTYVAIEHDGWRLIEGSDGSVELYDVTRDPGETRDVASAHPDRVDALRARVPRRATKAAGTRARPIDPAARRRLEALGYVGED